jgi:predicted small secreted protein
MTARIIFVCTCTCLLAGCATFQEAGRDMQAAGSAVKEDCRTIGPNLKQGFGQVKEGFSELGQGIANDFREAADQIKR